MFRVGWWLIVAMAAQVACYRLLWLLGYSGTGIVDDLVFYGVIYTVVLVFCRNHTGNSWADLVPLRGFALWLLVPVVLASLGGLVLSFQAVAFCRAVTPFPDGVFEVATGVSQQAGGAGAPSLPSALMSSAVIAPVFEEALMRGLVLGGLAATMSKRRALVLSALFFAAMHGAIERAPGTFSSGLLYGWMFVRTGSIIPGIIAHALHNGLIEILERADRFPGASKGLIGVDHYGLLPAWTTWTAAAMFVAGAILIGKASRRPGRSSLDEEYELAA